MAEAKEKVDQFSSQIFENDKDPWKPIQSAEMIPTIPLPISSPNENFIPPERYIESLGLLILWLQILCYQIIIRSRWAQLDDNIYSLK